MKHALIMKKIKVQLDSNTTKKATTLLNFYEITNNELDYVIEDNPLKEGKTALGVRIPIKNNF